MTKQVKSKCLSCAKTCQQPDTAIVVWCPKYEKIKKEVEDEKTNL